jgi:hypothetical protein
VGSGGLRDSPPEANVPCAIATCHGAFLQNGQLVLLFLPCFIIAAPLPLFYSSHSIVSIHYNKGNGAAMMKQGRKRRTSCPFWTRPAKGTKQLKTVSSSLHRYPCSIHRIQLSLFTIMATLAPPFGPELMKQGRKRRTSCPFWTRPAKGSKQLKTAGTVKMARTLLLDASRTDNLFFFFSPVSSSLHRYPCSIHRIQCE